MTNEGFQEGIYLVLNVRGALPIHVLSPLGLHYAEEEPAIIHAQRLHTTI